MLLPKELAARYQAVPVRFVSDDLLLVAVADPTDVGRADDLRLALGHNVRLAVSEPADLERTIKKLYRTQIEVVESTDEAVELLFDPVAQREDIAESSDDTPAVKLVHATLAQAIEDGASDIHFEPRGGRHDRPRADRRRHAARRADPEADAARRDQPPEDHGQPRHRRAARAAGRTRLDPLPRQPARPAHRDHADHLRRAGRAPDHAPRRLEARPRRARHDGRGARALREGDPAAVRRRRRLRPDRQRQDDDALHGAAPARTTRGT